MPLGEEVNVPFLPEVAVEGEGVFYAEPVHGLHAGAVGKAETLCSCEPQVGGVEE